MSVRSQECYIHCIASESIVSSESTSKQTQKSQTLVTKDNGTHRVNFRQSEFSGNDNHGDTGFIV